uniref:NADH-ubiquinone oxidoreductase chain 4L n=1 Tax=Neanthes glandicincta TaxID=595970 RepID=A0A343J7G2_9ANNE|nr:NADH dehydrogenase subunit 4L [Neanthes glandicincta]ASW20412.1 NADH dehydrogenase subunit 4L [Neanthes glandicincta]
MIPITCVMLQRQHLLMALLAFEGMILTILVTIMVLMLYSWMFVTLIILTFGACGASLGLACMVMMARSYGNDHISSLSTNKC